MVTKTDSVQSKLSERITRPFNIFLKTEQLSGLILVICTLLALILTNLVLFEEYNAFWETTLTVKFGNFGLSKYLSLWINDGLMAIFFFVIGLEIKREIIVGELNSLRKASLPIIAALGGMVIPVAIYIIFNINNPESFAGWGIPI